MTLSATAIAEAFKEHSGVAWFTLLTITHPNLDEPIRVVNSRDDLTSNGHKFIGFPFQIVLPGEDGENTPSAKLKFDNVDRSIYDSIWALDPAPYVEIDLVISSNPDQIEYSVGNLRLQSVQMDEVYFTGELVPASISLEPFPGDSFTPSRFPGLF